VKAKKKTKKKENCLALVSQPLLDDITLSETPSMQGLIRAEHASFLQLGKSHRELEPAVEQACLARLRTSCPLNASVRFDASCLRSHGAFKSKLLQFPGEDYSSILLCPSEKSVSQTRAFFVVRFGSLADILTSPRHVRCIPNNGRWAAHPRRHLEEPCHQSVTNARLITIKRPHHTSVVPPV
jgi:hypothetical protein